MRSRRSRFEVACRVAAFGLLGWLLGAALFPSPDRRTESASATDLAARLGAWTRASPATALHGDFAVAPPSWELAWLAALKRSGHAVSWSGAPPAVAMSVEPLADPAGGSRIDIAAPPGTSVLVRDAEGMIDSVRVARLGASVIGPDVVAQVVGVGAGQRFGVPAPDSPTPRAIVVVGSASWEGKFIASALEERGWTVIAHFSVAPNVVVGAGGRAAAGHEPRLCGGRRGYDSRDPWRRDCSLRSVRRRPRAGRTVRCFAICRRFSRRAYSGRASIRRLSRTAQSAWDRRDFIR